MMRRLLTITTLFLGLAAGAQGVEPGEQSPEPAPAAPRTLDQWVDELRNEEQHGRDELDRVVTELDQAEVRIVARGRAYTKIARVGLLPVAGGADALVEHAARLERLRRALKRDQQLEKRLVARRLVLVQRLAEIERQRAPLEAQQAVLASSRAALLAERDRQDAFERAFSATDASHATVYAAPPLGVAADGNTLRSGFAELRGELPLPLAGRAEVRPAGDGALGCEFGAASGTGVQAVHAGRVVFAGPYQTRGKAVIVDHGLGHETLSAGLQVAHVSVGEYVRAGTLLGTVAGKRGGQARPLYFEVRLRGQPVRCAPWFGL